MKSRLIQRLAIEASRKAAPAEDAIRKHRGAMELIRDVKAYNTTHARPLRIPMDRLLGEIHKFGIDVGIGTLRKVYNATEI